jgi:neurofibromin 1
MPTNTVLYDLNMACLRAVVKLLDRLQLRPLDTSNTGDDAVHYVVRLFNKYSTALLMSLDTCEPEMVSPFFKLVNSNVQFRIRHLTMA